MQTERHPNFNTPNSITRHTKPKLQAPAVQNDPVVGAVLAREWRPEDIESYTEAAREIISKVPDGFYIMRSVRPDVMPEGGTVDPRFELWVHVAYIDIDELIRTQGKTVRVRSSETTYRRDSENEATARGGQNENGSSNGFGIGTRRRGDFSKLPKSVVEKAARPFEDLHNTHFPDDFTDFHKSLMAEVLRDDILRTYFPMYTMYTRELDGTSTVVWGDLQKLRGGSKVRNDVTVICISYNAGNYKGGKNIQMNIFGPLVKVVSEQHGFKLDAEFDTVRDLAHFLRDLCNFPSAVIEARTQWLAADSSS